VHSELGLEALSEGLQSIDVKEFNSIREIGDEIVKIIRSHTAGRPELADRLATRPFYLSSVVSAVMPIPYLAHDLEEFLAMVQKVSNHSIYFHYVESRLRVGPQSNDFSLWIEQQLGLPDLAESINTVDISMSTQHDMRRRIVETVSEYVSKLKRGQEGGPS
jgi:hypothetical protein